MLPNFSQGYQRRRNSIYHCSVTESAPGSLIIFHPLITGFSCGLIYSACTSSVVFLVSIMALLGSSVRVTPVAFPFCMTTVAESRPGYHFIHWAGSATYVINSSREALKL